MHAKYLCLGLLTLLLTAPLARAQNSQNSQNPDNRLQQINGVTAGGVQAGSESTALHGDNSDLAGLQAVNKYPVPKIFTLSTSQSAFWTDNAYLTNSNNKVSSFGYNGRLQATLVPYSTYDWTPSISFEQQFVRYDHTSSLDFDAQTVRVASKYDLTKDKSWSSVTAVSAQRLYTDKYNQGEFYKEGVAESEIDYVHTIFGRTDLYFVGSLNIAGRLTEPDYYTQVDNSLLASVVYAPMSCLRMQAYARPSIACYTDNLEIDPATNVSHKQGRTDYNAALGLVTTYSPIKQVSLSAGFNWIGNYSNLSNREYRTITPALTVSGSIGW